MQHGFPPQIPDLLWQVDKWQLMTKYAGKIFHFYLTYENVNKTDSFLPSGSNEPFIYLNYDNNYYDSI